jgi:hypothetical protein
VPFGEEVGRVTGPDRTGPGRLEKSVAAGNKTPAQQLVACHSAVDYHARESKSGNLFFVRINHMISTGLNVMGFRTQCAQ